MDHWKRSSPRASADGPQQQQQHRRRNGRFIGAASVCLALVGMGSLPDTFAFFTGEPIEVKVTEGDTLDIAFEGVNTDALAISFMQCSGDSYLRMSLKYNDTTVGFSTLYNNECNRFLASDATASDEEVSYGNLCAFRSSAAVGEGYTENTIIVNDTSYVQPSLVGVVLENRGEAEATGQLVVYAENDPAPHTDDTIDRVQTVTDLVDNTYTVSLDFQSSSNGDDSFCSTSTGCALYAYYMEVDADDDADLVFGTTCQAEMGTLFYEEVVTTRTTATLATTSFTVAACLQFPSNIEASYRVYLVLSPDNVTGARVGENMSDQLIFASDVLYVDGDSDAECPEEVETADASESSGGITRIVPARATGGLAVSLAAAAAATARGGGGGVMLGEF